MNVTLDLATTEELVTELFSRPTFAGVIVYSPECHRNPGQHHNDLQVKSTCEPQSMAFLLQSGLAALEKLS